MIITVGIPKSIVILKMDAWRIRRNRGLLSLNKNPYWQGLNRLLISRSKKWRESNRLHFHRSWLNQDLIPDKLRGAFFQNLRSSGEGESRLKLQVRPPESGIVNEDNTDL
jgi:hypothetical protein